MGAYRNEVLAKMYGSHNKNFGIFNIHRKKGASKIKVIKKFSLIKLISLDAKNILEDMSSKWKINF